MIQHYQYHGGTIHDIQIDTHISRITWNTYIRDEGYRRNIKRITELLLNSCTIAPFLSWSAVAMYLPGTIVSSEQTSRQQQQQHWHQQTSYNERQRAASDKAARMFVYTAVAVLFLVVVGTAPKGNIMTCSGSACSWNLSVLISDPQTELMRWITSNLDPCGHLYYQVWFWIMIRSVFVIART